MIFEPFLWWCKAILPYLSTLFKFAFQIIEKEPKLKKKEKKRKMKPSFQSNIWEIRFRFLEFFSTKHQMEFEDWKKKIYSNHIYVRSIFWSTLDQLFLFYRKSNERLPCQTSPPFLFFKSSDGWVNKEK